MPRPENVKPVVDKRTAKAAQLLQARVSELVNKVSVALVDPSRCSSTACGCTGAKYDDGKVRLDLITPEFELEMGKVLTDGAKVHGEYSWQTIDKAVTRYTAALKRHTNAMARGEILDPTTGSTHAAHIAVNAMFLHYFQTM